MKHQKFVVLLSYILLLGGCATTTSVQTQTQPQYHRPGEFWTNKKAVVQVLHFYNRLATDDKGGHILDANGKPTIQRAMIIGTGAVVDVSGLVVTNYHVTKKLPVELAPNQPTKQLTTLPPEIYNVCQVTSGIRDCYDAEVVAVDVAHDIALVRADHHFSQTVGFVDDSELAPGDEVYFWGNVFAYLPPSPFFGRYTGRLGPPYYTGTNFSTQLPLLVLDINTSPGSSGSPVFDELGRCIGLVYGYFSGSDGPRPLGLIIPSSAVMKFLKENPSPSKK